MGIEVNELIERMTKEGKSSAEIALAVSQMYEAAVNKAREEEEHKRRALMLERGRQAIRAAIFGGLRMNKGQQISWLYTYANDHAEAIRDYVVANANKPDTSDTEKAVAVSNMESNTIRADELDSDY